MSITESSSYGAMSTSDSKRRKVETESLAGHVRAERQRAAITDKAKANYLSGQLRLRLQYAKLKVEHGWQRQSLSEVENLYFRHTHLTRPYPVISPGGRRNGRTLSSNSFSAAMQQDTAPSPTILHREQFLHIDASQGSNGTLLLTSSKSSTTSSMPSTPAPDTSRIATPLAPHVGFGPTLTRYPISRSDSSQTLIAESTPSLYPASPPRAHPPPPSTSPTASAFREPFDPMEPTEHLDSQLAALRSIISASSALPLPLPPPSPAHPAPLTPLSTNTAPGMPAGLTYDAFWSAHGSATASFRSLLAGGQGAHPTRASANTSAGAGGTPLQPHASAPAILTFSAHPGTHTNGSTSQVLDAPYRAPDFSDTAAALR